MTEATPESTERRPGRRAPLIVTAVLLAAVAGAAVWLQATDRLPPPEAGTPAIVVDLPADMPVEPATGAPTVADEPANAQPAPAVTAEAAAPAEHPAPPGPVGVEHQAETGPGTPAAADTPSDSAAPEPEELAAAGREAESAGQPADAAPPPPAPPVTDPGAPGEALEKPQMPAQDPQVAAVPETPPAPEIEEAPASEGPAPDPDSAASGAPEAAAAEAPQLAMVWQRLARPFPADETRPRIAVVVAGLGLSEAATTAAIQQLPAEVTLSFSPYSNRLEEFIAMARAAGHEVLLDLPMEPASFPRDDPGPRALLTSLDEDANAERLAWTLGRADGYLGVATYMGSRFTTSPEDLRPVIEELGRRGLLLLDSRAAADSIAARLAADTGVAHAINDRFIDNEASRVAIDGRLQQIERIARSSGVAVAMGYAYPVTIERLTEWARGLAGEGLALAPISAVVNRQEVR